MIYETLYEISTQLNQHLKIRFGLTEDKLFLSNLVDQQGQSTIDEDCVVMMPVNIQEEKYLSNLFRTNINPPVSLNIFVLFTTTFNGKLISESLKYISEIISFFQQEKVIIFDGNKIKFEFFNIDINTQFNLWASLGAKYSPSVVYKVSLIMIDDDMPASDLNYSSSFPG